MKKEDGLKNWYRLEKPKESQLNAMQTPAWIWDSWARKKTLVRTLAKSGKGL